MKFCPQCQSESVVKSGVVNEKQRYKCKDCGYHFTVNKTGKQIDMYYVTKALQLYLEGLTYREIERIIGVSHVSVMNWVRKYNIHRVTDLNCHPTYKILSQLELASYFIDPKNTKGAGVIVTELGDKYMVIKWERFK